MPWLFRRIIASHRSRESIVFRFVCFVQVFSIDVIEEFFGIKRVFVETVWTRGCKKESRIKVGCPIYLAL